MRTLNAQDRALVVLLPKRLWPAINIWRREHDPNYGLVLPHITVAYPPFVPEEQWSRLRPGLRQCLGRFHPFRVLLHGLGTFENDSHVLWLQVRDGGHLSRIRAALMHCSPEHVPPLPFGYVPHVTIGVFQSRSELEQMQEAMGSQVRPRFFTVRHLTYLSPGEDGVWSVCRHIPLGMRDER